MKFYKKIKFPCGYEYEGYVDCSPLFTVIDEQDLDKCPLHGRECRSPKK